MMKTTWLIALLSIVALAGCQAPMNLKPKWPWERNDLASVDAVPQQMIVLWTDTVYSPPGHAPTRGFGGRVYFYNDRHQSMPVTGQLVVYAYDDSKEVVSRTTPDRKYVFTAEQLAKYYSQSDLGHSYNLWIPWDQLGGYQREISLIPMFTDAQTGMVVQAKPSSNVLPGEKILNERERRGFFDSMPADRFRNAGAADVEQVSYHQGVPEGQMGSSGIRTTTIQLPHHMASRWARGSLATPNLSVAHRPASVPNAPAPATTGRYAPPQANPENPPPSQPGYGSSATPPGQNRDELVYGTPLGQTGFTGSSQTNPSTTARPWAREDARSAHFEQPRFPAPAAPGAPPGASPPPSRFRPAR